MEKLLDFSKKGEINRIKKINYDIVYFDGLYKTVREFEYLGVPIPSNFSWNGVTGIYTDKKLIYPSMLHDFLLKEGYPRKMCDVMFLKAMEYEKVSWVRRRAYYSVVRGYNYLGGV